MTGVKTYLICVVQCWNTDVREFGEICAKFFSRFVDANDAWINVYGNRKICLTLQIKLPQKQTDVMQSSKDWTQKGAIYR